MELEENIILIDKPKGITSFDVIRQLRKDKTLNPMGVKKLGHAGTLDPFATGLLVIGVGEGTKKLNEFLKLPKTYKAEILIGVKTDTGDITGEVIEEEDVAEISLDHILDVLSSMKGELELPVPAYSAIKQGGEALYKKARRGEEVNLPIKKMTVYDLHSYSTTYDSEKKKQVVEVEFHVGSGTYIRSLGEELGRRLEYPATVQELRRTSVGSFDIKDARTLVFE